MPTAVASSTDAGSRPPARVFISAAEPSADRHAADLIRALRRLCPGATFWGVAGPLMQAAGCKPIDDLTARSAMLVGAVRLAGHCWRLLGRVRRMLAADPPDLVVLVDSPALHLPMAREARRAGCPTLYYIAPQLWAWAPWRIRRLRRRVDRLAVILPFEETYFGQRGVAATYVGHPLVEQLQYAQLRQDLIEAFRQGGRPVVACLPGSRRHVIREVLPGQLEVAQAIAARHPQATFLFAAADERAAGMIREAASGLGTREGASGGSPSLGIRVEVGANSEILAAADLALVASGTATLEVAWHRVPMVVMYNGSKWGYRLVGRFLVRTPHLSLVNILAGRRIVPEFMPYYTSTEPIAAEALDLLANQPRREQVRSELDAVIRSLGTGNAAGSTAAIAREMIGQLAVGPQ